MVYPENSNRWEYGFMLYRRFAIKEFRNFFFLAERPSPGAYGAPDSAFPFSRIALYFYINKW